VKRIKQLIILAIVVVTSGCSLLQQAPNDSSQASSLVNSIANNTIVQQLEAQYAEWKGVKYAYGGLKKSGVDCSGFVYRTFKDRLNKLLPRSTVKQSEIGRSVEISNLQSGDLVFFKTGFKVRHVGIYTSGNNFLHASTSKGVMISNLDNPYWKDAFWQARRVLSH